ncbi:MAG TPA: hypothetical protein VG389_15900 [Myxococcota bacterium]|nr:hypothetical protein [Myxococcota bacterium]
MDEPQSTSHAPETPAAAPPAEAPAPEGAGRIPDPRRDPRTATVLAALAAIAVLAIIAFVFLRSPPQAAPGDHAAAAAALAAVVQPADLVVVISADPAVLAPYHAKGLKAVAAEKVPAAATVGFARLWVVKPRGAAPLPSTAAPGAPPAAALAAEFAADPVLGRMTPGPGLDAGLAAPEILSFTLPGGAMGFDFAAEFKRARVSVLPDGGGAPLACPLAGDKHQCPTFKHVWFGPRDVVVSGAHHSCLWAHPYKGGTLEIVYPGVKAGKSLNGRYAFTDGGAAASKKPPLTLEVTAGTVVSKLSAPRARGFKDFSIPLAGVAPGAAVDVTFRVSTPDTGAAHFCFDAFMVE